MRVCFSNSGRSYWRYSLSIKSRASSSVMSTRWNTNWSFKNFNSLNGSVSRSPERENCWINVPRKIIRTKSLGKITFEIDPTNKLKIAELDFDAIKETLITYLQGQDEFKDYDFVGSAMNILMDILAYNTHYNGFYTNMLASEMFLDSATLRSSIVSLAKHLGYIPSSRRGASINIDLVFTGDTAQLTVP